MLETVSEKLSAFFTAPYPKPSESMFKFLKNTNAATSSKLLIFPVCSPRLLFRDSTPGHSPPERRVILESRESNVHGF